MPSVTVRAVAEPTPRSIAEVVAMVRSLRRFGGRLADAPTDIRFVDTLPGDLRELETMNVSVSTVERVDRRCPHANKLGMFTAVDTDYLLAVDADILVAGDISEHLVGDAIAAVPAYGDFLDQADWRHLFDDTQVRPPAGRVLTVHRRQVTYPYFNSGVLLVPAARIDALHDAWRRFIEPTIACAEQRNWPQHKRFFVDQLALTLALAAADLPYRELPMTMNWLINCTLPASCDPDSRAPLLMHTIHEMDHATGHIHEIGHRRCRQAIRDYNATIGRPAA